MTHTHLGIGSLTVLLLIGGVLGAEEKTLDQKLAGVTFADGWKCSGTPTTYDSKNLYELIDGEAELYFPYGFKRVIAADYVAASDPDQMLAAEVYEVGTLLDAFGVYSNYREKESRLVGVGCEGFMGSTQIMFYQDRMFVKLRASGKSPKSASALLPCAQAIAKVLPMTASKPAELDMLHVKDLVPQTEQYFAQSLLGYDFFSMGLVADAILGQQPIRIFVVIDINAKNAKQTLARYEAYLDGAKTRRFTREETFGKVLVARDPLHKGTLVKQVGNCLVGVTKLEDPAAGMPVIERLLEAVKACNKS